MPQKRIEIPAVGVWPAMRARILAVAEKHRAEANLLVKAAGRRERIHYGPSNKPIKIESCPDREVLDSLLDCLTQIAVDPAGKITRFTTPPDFLFGCYANAPELTLAVLTKARSIWFKNSKATRLWRWMASNEGILTDEHKSKRVSVWQCTDCDLARAFELAGGKPVSNADVEKARVRLAFDIRRGQRNSPAR